VKPLALAPATFAVLSLAACGKPAAPPAQPSVLVTTQPARQGNAPYEVTVYGSAMPATDALRTLTLQQPAQVRTIAVTPGAPVRAGQRLIDFVLSASAVAAYRQAEAALRLAKAQQLHANQLLAQQLATKDQVAQADAAVNTAQAALTALAQQGAGSSAGGLTAPFDGFVVAIPVAAGDLVQPGAPLITVARRSGLVVTAGFEPVDAQRLRTGQPASVLDLSGGQSLPGTVLRVATALNPKTRLIDGDIKVPAAVIPGDAFRVTVTVGQVQGWLAPHRAVLNDTQGDYVFQVSGARAVRVPVTVVSTSGDTDVLQGGLDASRPLVVDGAFQLQPGALVRTAVHS
jgi:RND family efflux transporter MFP subunit